VSVAEPRRIGAARFPGWSEFPPIWILVVAGSFCAYFALLVYCDLFRPKNPGYEADPTHTGAVVVTRVEAETPAFQAGMAVGDHLIAINGLTIIDSDGWGALGANYQTGVSMPVIVERNGVRLTLSMLLPAETPDYWVTRTGATLIGFRLAQLVPLMAGLFIAWRRPRDPRALAASWFLLTCAAFTIALPYRFATVWRDLPVLDPIRQRPHDRPYPAHIRHGLPQSPALRSLHPGRHVGSGDCRSGVTAVSRHTTGLRGDRTATSRSEKPAPAWRRHGLSRGGGGADRRALPADE
jgi:PDZ domain